MIKQVKIGDYYDPDGIKQFVVRTLKVGDRETLDKILSVYDDWYHNRTRAAVHVNENTKEGEIDECLVIRTRGTNEEPTNVYISHKRDVEKFIWREQPILKEGKLAGLSHLEIGALTFDDNFHYKYADNKGTFNFGGGLYESSIFRRLKYISDKAKYSSGSDLCRELARLTGHLGEYDLINNRQIFTPIMEHAASIEQQSIRVAVRQFLSRMDPDAMRLAFKARLPDTYAYEWLMGHSDREEGDGSRWRVVSPEAIRNRRSAVFVYPCLLPTFIADDSSRDINDNLDKGMSVPQAILSGVRPNTWRSRNYKSEEVTLDALKWYQGKKLYFFDGFKGQVNSDLYNILNNIHWLNALPRDWRPRTPEEFFAFRRMSSSFSDYEGLIGKSKTVLMRDFVAALNRPGGLPQFKREVEGAKDGKPARIELKPIFDVVSPVQAMVTLHVHEDGNKFALSRGVNDALDSIGNQIILPEVYRQFVLNGLKDRCYIDQNDSSDIEKLTKNLMPHIFGEFGVLKILSFSERWHAQEQRLNDRTGRIDKDMNWHPVVADFVTPEGVSVHAMSSTSEIRAMGDVNNMNNCIGGYTYQCAIGKSHVIVLTASDKSWKTNMEIRENDGLPRTVGIVQHSARGNNTQIPEAAKKAAEWLVERINRQKLDVDWGSVDEGREVYRKDAIMLKIGFDPESRVACDEAYLAWHGTMRDILPDASRDDFLERSGIRNAIQAEISEILRKQSRNPSRRLDAA